VIDLIDLLEEMQHQKPEDVPYDPGRDPDVALLDDTIPLLNRLAILLKQQDDSHSAA
jgi:hypothetical protein